MEEVSKLVQSERNFIGMMKYLHGIILQFDSRMEKYGQEAVCLTKFMFLCLSHDQVLYIYTQCKLLSYSCLQKERLRSKHGLYFQSSILLLKSIQETLFEANMFFHKSNERRNPHLLQPPKP